jgi:hypothetical protein
VKSPFNYNLAPSPKSTLNKVTATFKLVVAAGTTTQITLFPGHGKFAQAPAGIGGANDLGTTSVDPTANHAMIQAFGGGPTRYVIGPISEESYTGSGALLPPAIGGVSPALTADTFTDSSAGMTPIVPDVASPYSAAVGGLEQEHGEHLRYKLVNQGIIFENITSGSNRGGNVATVQPEYNTLPAGGSNQSKLRMYSSWHDHGVAEGPVQVNTAQRPQDLAFWHKVPMAHANALPACSTTSVTNGAIHLFFNAGAFEQRYMINIIQNYQISGIAVETVSTLNPHEPAQKGTFETIVSTGRTLQAGAHGFAKAAAAMSDTAYKTAQGSVGMASKVLASSAAAAGFLTKAGAALGFAAAA